MQASKKFSNKCSENSRSQILFRTDIFQKSSLGAPDRVSLKEMRSKYTDMRSSHAICVALSCHTRCHKVGLKVIVFVYTCNVCYTVLGFFLELAIYLPSLFRSFDIEHSDGRSSLTLYISVACQ